MVNFVSMSLGQKVLISALPPLYSQLKIRVKKVRVFLCIKSGHYVSNNWQTLYYQQVTWL